MSTTIQSAGIKRFRKFFSVLCISFLVISSPQRVTSGYQLDLTYQNLDGEIFSYTAFDGEFLLVETFWTDCSHCIAQHHDLVTLNNNFGVSAANGSKLNLISLAGSRDDLVSINEWVADYPSDWIIGLDAQNRFQNVYGIEATPTMILFNQNGEPVHVWIGRTQYSELTNVVIPYLTGQETATLDRPLDQIGQVGSGGQDSLIGNFFASTYVQFIVLSFMIIIILSRSTSPVAIEDLSRQIRKTNTKAATQIKDGFEKTFEKTAK